MNPRSTHNQQISKHDECKWSWGVLGGGGGGVRGPPKLGFLGTPPPNKVSEIIIVQDYKRTKNNVERSTHIQC